MPSFFSRPSVLLLTAMAINSSLIPIQGAHAREAQRSDSGVRERDLSIVLSKNSTIALENDGIPIFRRSWLQEIQSGFAALNRAGSRFRSAFTNESTWDQWRLISLRIVPCENRGRARFHAPDSFCWPQVRLTWQPVRPGIRFSAVGGARPDLSQVGLDADDQAIHEIFDVNPRQFLSETDAARVQSILSAGRGAMESTDPNHFSAIMTTQLDELGQLRRVVVAELIRDTLRLRAPELDEDDYAGYGIRPEIGDKEKAFTDRLKIFLNRYARLEDVQRVAVLGIPPGGGASERQAWAMMGFNVQGERLVPAPMDLYSFESNQIYAKAAGFVSPSGNAQVTGSTFDDLFVNPDAAPDSEGGLGDETKLALSLNVIDRQSLRGPNDEVRQRILERMLDTEQTNLANTACFSCHLLKENINDFHNLSYFEREPLTVSPRVEKDVERDLDWLKAQGIDITQQGARPISPAARAGASPQ